VNGNQRESGPVIKWYCSYHITILNCNDGKTIEDLSAI